MLVGVYGGGVVLLLLPRVAPALSYAVNGPWARVNA